MELLFMDPVFKEAIWGGTKLRDVFDYEIPSDTTGECWAISGHANGMSRVAGGRFDGKTLGELWKEESMRMDLLERPSAGTCLTANRVQKLLSDTMQKTRQKWRK